MLGFLLGVLLTISVLYWYYESKVIPYIIETEIENYDICWFTGISESKKDALVSIPLIVKDKLKDCSKTPKFINFENCRGQKFLSCVWLEDSKHWLCTDSRTYNTTDEIEKVCE